MLKGTRVLEGNDAKRYVSVIDKIRIRLISAGFMEVIIPLIWEQQTFIDKAGPEIISQMWAFQDKGNRPVTLIPEVTGIIQELWRDNWSKNKKSPYKIFYISRCYRYEKPQAGRYREFTQLGIEILGPKPDSYREEAISLLNDVLELFDVDYYINDSVKRGLSYYVNDGFEAVVDSLGAQKQIAGGGTYDEGCGWAIGIDRLLLAMK